MSFLDTLLGRKHPPMIGLDISSSSVKLVELGQTKSGDFVLERFASEPFEKGWITDGQIEKFDEVAAAVKRVVSKSGTKTKQVVMAMPQSAVITKKIMLPAGLREEEMEIQVESEANQYIPFSLDEVSLDFCVIGPSPTSAGDVEVLIAASRKDRVQDRQGLAEAAGLKPTHITQQDHLNAWEQENIRTGRRWALQQVRKKVDLLDQVFVRQLHRRMFGDTWEWAGTYRNTDKTIGVPWEQIGPKLAQLLGNTQYQIDNAVFPADELAVRFHHALVWIHPFPNGNGRHSRMMGDLLAMQLGAPAFTWGAGADL